MALYSNSLADLVVRMLKVPMRDYKGGTCTTAVSTTSFKDTSRREADDYFQNTSPISRIRIISTTDGAAPVGEEAELTDFVQSDGAFTYAPATTAVAVGDKYVILSEYYWYELAEAINAAIDIGTSKGLLIHKIDEQITMQDSTYEYNVPTGFTHIYRLAQENDSGDYPEPIPPTHYKIIRGATIPKIHFIRFPLEGEGDDLYYSSLWVEESLDDGKHLRVEGLGRQAELEYESDICYLDPNYIVYQAAALVHGAHITQAASDYDNHRVQAEYCEAKAREFLTSAKRNSTLPPNTKKVEG